MIFNSSEAAGKDEQEHQGEQRRTP